jgi:ABC-2 type transport system permease protein
MTFLRKAFGIGRRQLAFEKVYRFNTFVWAFGIPLVFLVNYFLWTSIFTASGQELIKGFTLNDMLLYYLLSYVTMILSLSHIDNIIPKMVKKGTLVKRLTKPINLITFSIIQDVWVNIFNVAILPLLFVEAYFLISLSSITSVNIILYIISLTVAYLLNAFYVFSFSMLSFWFKEYVGIKIMRKGLANFLMGSIMPLTFFPLAMQKVFAFLPFQYMLYVPVQIGLGKYSLMDSLRMIGLQSIWVFIFVAVALFAWKKAQTKFMGVGT